MSKKRRKKDPCGQPPTSNPPPSSEDRNAANTRKEPQSGLVYDSNGNHLSYSSANPTVTIRPRADNLASELTALFARQPAVPIAPDSFV